MSALTPSELDTMLPSPSDGVVGVVVGGVREAVGGNKSKMSICGDWRPRQRQGGHGARGVVEGQIEGLVFG